MEVNLRQRHCRSEGPCHRPEICRWCSSFRTREERKAAFRAIVDGNLISQPAIPRISQPQGHREVSLGIGYNLPPLIPSYTNNMEVFDGFDGGSAQSYNFKPLELSHATNMEVIDGFDGGNAQSLSYFDAADELSIAQDNTTPLVDPLEDISTLGYIKWPRIDVVNRWRFTKWDEGEKSKVAVNFEDATINENHPTPSPNVPPLPGAQPRRIVHQNPTYCGCRGEPSLMHSSPAQDHQTRCVLSTSGLAQEYRSLGGPHQLQMPLFQFQLPSQQELNRQVEPSNQALDSQGDRTGTTAPTGIISAIIQTSRQFYRH
ncbi:hypothetical protein RUND412_003364 [Rhizina undulata]